MNKKYSQEALDLLKVWFFIKTNNILWPSAVTALEDRINELLESDDWRPLNNEPR